MAAGCGHRHGFGRRGLAKTVLTLRQAADVVTGHYEGGAIVAGFLAGRVDAVGLLRFCYAQTDREGRVDSGISTADLRPGA